MVYPSPTAWKRKQYGPAEMMRFDRTRIKVATSEERKGQAPPFVDPVPVEMPGLRSPLKVFLVEDVPFVRERVSERITSTGRVMIVGFADSDAEAIEKLPTVNCDVLVLDLALRKGTGFQVLRWLRNRGADNPYVIVFTDYAQAHFRELTMELGADCFLDKAIDFDHLLGIIEGLSRFDSSNPI